MSEIPSQKEDSGQFRVGGQPNTIFDLYPRVKRIMDHIQQLEYDASELDTEFYRRVLSIMKASNSSIIPLSKIPDKLSYDFPIVKNWIRPFDRPTKTPLADAYFEKLNQFNSGFFIWDQPWPFTEKILRLPQDLTVSDIDLQDKQADNKDASTIIIDESRQAQRIITDIYRQETSLLKLRPREFEELVAELLRHQGFEVELTKQTRDGGYDIIAIRKIDKIYPVKFLVECKRLREDKIGVDIVRGLMAVVQEKGATKGMIATTSYFTRDAIHHKEQVYQWKLDFIDQQDILSWISNYGRERLMLRG